MMFHFCELDAAARMRPRAASVGPPAASPGGQMDGSASIPSQLGSPRGSLGAQAPAGAGSSTQLSPMHSYAPSWSGSEASDLFPGSSSSSLAASAAAAAAALGGGSLADSPAQHLHQSHHHDRTPLRPQQAQHAQQVHGSAHSGSPAHGSRQQLVAPGALLPGGAAMGAAGLPSPGAGASLGVGGQLRLALPVQQRGAAKAAARLLREQLATAQADLQGEPWLIADATLPLCLLGCVSNC